MMHMGNGAGVRTRVGLGVWISVYEMRVGTGVS